VDPDNRRPVDYPTRMSSLSSSPDPTELLRSWTDGRIKQWLIGRVLTTRRQFPELFSRDDYQPLRLHGQHAHRLVAFCCRQGDHVAVVLAPRPAAPLSRDSEQPLTPPGNWGDTLVDLSAVPLCSALTGTPVRSGPAVPVSELLAETPVNLLVPLCHQAPRHE